MLSLPVNSSLVLILALVFMEAPVSATLMVCSQATDELEMVEDGAEDGPVLSAEGVAFFEQRIRPVLVQECYECHAEDASKLKGGLFLDTRNGTLLGGDSGPAVVPGDPASSLLWSAINYADIEMPPREKLAPEILDDFRRWIEMGAPDPRDGRPLPLRSTVDSDQIEAGRGWWSFQAPVLSQESWVIGDNWSSNSLDRFIYGALCAQGLEPNRDAEPAELLRRLSFDLIGLPPSPAELHDFAAAYRKNSDRAISDTIDRLLADSGYGERWGRHWLDLARFAESTGRELNSTLPQAWRYRNWVIDAVNRDLPCDQFVMAQLAGDLLPVDSDQEWSDNLIATGFLAMGTKALRERSKRQFRADQVDEQIDATSRVFLGLSLACARCHDHKFEPIQQADYYSVAGIFNSTATYFGTLDARPNRQASRLITLPVQDRAYGRENDRAGVDLNAEELQKLRNEFDQLEGRQVDLQRELRAIRLGQKNAAADQSPVDGVGADPARSVFRELVGVGNRLARIESLLGSVDAEGRKLAQCMGVQEAERVGDVSILIRGEVDQQGDVVPRGLIQVLDDPTAPFDIPSGASGRLQLARWIASEENPLTARVIANRVWQHLMGSGLVSSPDDFGSTGSAPSHPALLDALALFLMEHDWSIKALIKEIASSRTYRVASDFNAAAFESDPFNRLHWRGDRRRLEAEAMRDAILSISGNLDRAQPQGSPVADMGDQTIGRRLAREENINAPRSVRSVYLAVARDALPAVLDEFDFAPPDRVVGLRESTSTPQQALFLLNDTFVRDQSLAFARRLRSEVEGLGRQVKTGFVLALGRNPSKTESAAAIQFIREMKASMKEQERRSPALYSLAAFCQALFASAEFRTLN